jgi:hypothetical protein
LTPGQFSLSRARIKSAASCSGAESTGKAAAG